MIEKLPILLPEIVLFITTVVVMMVGQIGHTHVRRAVWYIAALGIAASGVLASATGDLVREAGNPLLPGITPYAKVLISVVGLLLVPLLAGTVDRGEEARIDAGTARFDPLRATRGEFWAFYLFSLTGLMLVASADDLIWLFLALELTSLPTYMMVAMSSTRDRAREAGVKYFFLGALGAAVFLYGFTLLYGAAGTTGLGGIAAAFGEQLADTGAIGPLGIAGLAVSILGLGFKIAAVPMHFYTADVYQGGASPVSAMLAFVPKAGGILALIALLATTGWAAGPDGAGLPFEIELLLWVMAALTMTVGNVLAWLQTSAKRMLAYSSIAHSGYMLVGLIAGPARPGEGFAGDGIAAALFYLLCYGVMNVGTFAVLASLERRAADGGEPEELDELDDLRGLAREHRALGWTMVICSLSLLGFPPLLGFWAKVGLFTSALSHGHIALVVVLALNSAAAAFYYLRLVSLPLLESRDEPLRFVAVPMKSRPFSAVISAGGVIVLVFAVPALMNASSGAAALADRAAPHGTDHHGIGHHAGDDHGHAGHDPLDDPDADPDASPDDSPADAPRVADAR